MGEAGQRQRPSETAPVLAWSVHLVRRAPHRIPGLVLVVFLEALRSYLPALLPLPRVPCLQPLPQPPGLLPSPQVLPVTTRASGLLPTSVSVSGLTSGVYVVTVAVSDRLGNVDPDGATATIVIDQEAPTASCVHATAAVLGVNAVAVSATAVDNLTNTTWSVSLDGGPWVSQVYPAVTFTGVPNGAHSVQCRAVDDAGNVQQHPYDTWTFVVDTRPPVVTLRAQPPRYVNNRTVPLCTAVSDLSPYTVTVAVDGLDVARSSSSSSSSSSTETTCMALRVDDDGNHTLVVTAVDVVGNSAPPTVVWWLLDTTPPSHTDVAVMPNCHTLGNTTVCNSTTAAGFVLRCDADVVGLPPQSPCANQWQLALLQRTSGTQACGSSSATTTATTTTDATTTPPSTPDGVNGSTTTGWTTAASVATVVPPVTADGLYQLTSRALDAAGNAAAVQTRQWWLDTSAPASPTILNPPSAVTFTVATVLKLQLAGDTSPGQLAFLYALAAAAAPATSDVQLRVPTLPAPNDAVVLLSVTVPEKDVPYTLKVWSVDQGGSVSTTPSLATWTVASTGSCLSC